MNNGVSYQIVVAGSNGMPMMVCVNSDEDLIKKYRRCRAEQKAFFEWEQGCFATYHVLGVFRF